MNFEKNIKRIKLITGPNASGKSVLVKQIALIVYLVHIGCFVPASKVTIGIMDGIFSKLSNHESSNNILSSFYVELKQISMALKYATNRSLIIVDEFGKGTIYENGIAIAASFIKHYQNSSVTPLLLYTTHYHEIFTLNLVNQNDKIEYLKMEVERNNKMVIFTYKLTNSSYIDYLALSVAKKYGLQEEIYERAREILDCLLKNRTISQAYRRNDDERMKKLIFNFLNDSFEEPIKYLTTIL